VADGLSQGSLDDATAEANVVVIESNRLTGCHSPLRLLKSDPNALTECLD
jgi:hypothetical protein